MARAVVSGSKIRTENSAPVGGEQPSALRPAGVRGRQRRRVARPARKALHLNMDLAQRAPRHLHNRPNR
jgi:hypothetical protein